MNISAKIPGELAVGAEKERVHTSGSDKGCLYIMNHYETSHLVTTGDADLDFKAAYLHTLERFLEDEPRVRTGHAFEVHIIA